MILLSVSRNKGRAVERSAGVFEEHACELPGVRSNQNALLNRPSFALPYTVGRNFFVHPHYS